MADSKASALGDAAALTGGEFWAGVQGGADRKMSSAQMSTYVLSQMSVGLTAIGSLTFAADKAIYFTGAGAAATFDLTGQARTFLAAADQAAQRAALGLPIGTSGAVVGLLNGANAHSSPNSFTDISVSGSLIRGGTAAIAYAVASGTSITPTVQSQSTTAGGAANSAIVTSGTAATCASYYLVKRGDAANAAVASGSRLGEFGWSASDGTNIIGAAAIRCEASAAFTTAAPSTRLLFMLANAAAPANYLTLAPVSLSPANDNAMSLGLGAARFSVVYAATGTINTSDERAKQDIAGLIDDDELLDAWGAVEWKKYRFQDAYASKGEDARWHMGLIAQQVRDVIDAALGAGSAIRLGLVCYDSWEALDEITEPLMASRAVQADTGEVDGDGDPVLREELEEFDTGDVAVVQQARAAGDRWGLRYDECFAIEAAWQRRQMARIEARLDAVTAAAAGG